MLKFSLGLGLLLGIATITAAQVWEPVAPGLPALNRTRSKVTIGNRALGLTMSGNRLLVKNRVGHGAASFRTLFKIVLQDGRSLTQDLPSVSRWSVSNGHGEGGATAIFRFRLSEENLAGTYQIQLLPNDNFARVSVTVRPVTTQPVAVKRIEILQGVASGAEVSGTCPGSPVVAGDLFFGLEHPMSQSVTVGGSFRCQITRKIPITQEVTYTAVIGASASGQLRRGFLHYVEATRAHRYRTFLHYNSWYDLGYFTPYTADQCVERINSFGQELTVKRKVHLNSFLFDDGWDNHSSVWEFSKDFPNGFLPLKAAAAKYNAGPGVWLSPWGGYGDPRTQRLAYAKEAGMEVDSEGYALSGPKYYQLFKARTLDFVEHQGVNQFKFDGTGSPDKQYPGSQFQSDFDAAIALIGDLRTAKPDLFINLTTGTWPSPFWTRFADSIWRGGSDHSFAGVGTWRQKWVTYRDGDTYHGVVLKGPLYPLNSLMLHGLIYAKYANHLDTDPGNDLHDDIWAYFSTGTGLQEMYVTPGLLTSKNWDDLAVAARWAKTRASEMVDSHWVGGDPMKLEVYGHAGWNGKRGYLELRNPSDRPQAFSVDLTRVLELPTSVKGSFRLAAPKGSGSVTAQRFAIGHPKVIMLKPFQVLVLEGAVR